MIISVVGEKVFDNKIYKEKNTLKIRGRGKLSLPGKELQKPTAKVLLTNQEK